MHSESLAAWTHEHSFGQEQRRPGERRTWIVIAITAATMAVEIVAGLAYGSMALLADGLHMASHAAALGIAAFAYAYTRRHASDARYSFGTGKVNSLAAFASAMVLALLALLMASESGQRLLAPVAIRFDQAILVAGLGLVVNGLSLLILRGRGHAHHGGGHGQHADEHAGHHHHEHERERDHNLWAAYLHVMADALTSLLAIAALVAAKFYGLNWLDAGMGLVGAALVLRWSAGLLRASTRVLLDRQAPAALRERVRQALEADGDTRVADLHVWVVGPGIHAASIALVATEPQAPPVYRARIPGHLGILHTTIEVHRCAEAPGRGGSQSEPRAGRPTSAAASGSWPRGRRH